jgi:hypothetical protein
VRAPKLLIAVAVLALGATACGADNPPGTISEDDLPVQVAVEKVRHDDQAGQVDCQEVNNAEDRYLLSVADNSDPGHRPAIAYELSGSHHQEVSNSVWRMPSPDVAVAAVAKGLDACVAADPDHYQRFEVKDHPDALGYTATEGEPALYTRRILVPLKDRVVVVTSQRQGGDDFAVQPEDLLKKAVDASKDAPKG